jgi:serine/threonine protein kinase
LLQNQTSRHLKTIKNLIFKVNLQYLENNKYEKEFEEKYLIGCGNYSIVYKAIESSNGKVYAIKKITLNDKDIEEVSKKLNIITELKFQKYH